MTWVSDCFSSASRDTRKRGLESYPLVAFETDALLRFRLVPVWALAFPTFVSISQKEQIMETDVSLALDNLTGVDTSQLEAEVGRLRLQNAALKKHIACMEAKLANRDAAKEAQEYPEKVEQAQHSARYWLTRGEPPWRQNESAVDPGTSLSLSETRPEPSATPSPKMEKCIDPAESWERHRWEAALAALRTQLDQMRFSRMLMQREMEALRADIVRLQVLLQHHLQDSVRSTERQSWWALQPVSPTNALRSSPIDPGGILPTPTNHDQTASHHHTFSGWIQVGDAIYEGNMKVVPPTNASAMAILRCSLERTTAGRSVEHGPEPELRLGPLCRRWNVRPAHPEDFQRLMDASAWSWLEAEAPAAPNGVSSEAAADSDADQRLAFLGRNESIMALLNQVRLYEQERSGQEATGDATRAAAPDTSSTEQPIPIKSGELVGLEESSTDLWGSFGRMLSRWVWPSPPSPNSAAESEEEVDANDMRGRPIPHMSVERATEKVSGNPACPTSQESSEAVAAVMLIETKVSRHPDIDQHPSLEEVSSSADRGALPTTATVEHDEREHELLRTGAASPYRSVLFSVDDPNGLRIHSQVLLGSHADAIRNALPHRHRRSDWCLVYSTAVHGASLYTLYTRTQRLSHSILAIRDRNGHVFGAFVAEAWRPNASAFYGTGECFVFRANSHGQVERYPWTGKNNFFQYSGPRFLAVGGGTHFALWLDNELLSGTSGYSETFDNPPLCTDIDGTMQPLSEFECVVLEVWSMTEVANSRLP